MNIMKQGKKTGVLSIIYENTATSENRGIEKLLIKTPNLIIIE